MTTTIHLPAPATCSECGFSTTDLHLLGNHSCDIALQGGRCEDYPCCGHENGDCNGLLYGSDEAIKSDPHLLCDHNTGYCEIEAQDDDDEVSPEDCTHGDLTMTGDAGARCDICWATLQGPRNEEGWF